MTMLIVKWLKHACKFCNVDNDDDVDKKTSDDDEDDDDDDEEDDEVADCPTQLTFFHDLYLCLSVFHNKYQKHSREIC